MKQLITIILLTITGLTHAATWPDGGAPCNTTLDACAEGLPEGSVILIQTNTINENINVFKAISLVADTGYRPVFTDGNGIELSVGGSSDVDLTIAGLTFERGRISVNHLGIGALTLQISNNHFLANSSSQTSIRLLQRGNGNMDVAVDFNTIHHTFTTSGAQEGAIKLINNLNSGDVTGRIYNNVVHVAGPEAVGIGIYDEQPGTIDLNVTGNEVFGASYGGIYARTTGTAGTMDLNVTSNAIYANQNSLFLRGIRMVSEASTLRFDAINNTVLGAFDGFNVFESGGVIDAEIHNNLVAYGFGESLPVFTNVTGITNDYNLFYAMVGTDFDFVPGPNHMTAKPMIKGLQDGRLLPGSPAIDAGDSLVYFLVADAPLIDADGTLRFKRLGPGAAVPDVGAYESGDVAFNHVAQTTNHISVLDNAAINGDINLQDLHVTANWNPAGTGGIYNNHHEGLYYEQGNWRVFNQDGITIPSGATFNIMKHSGKSNTFEHTAAGGSTTTRIDRVGMDGEPDLIVQVSQHWTGVYNDNAFGVYYLSGHWYIINMGGDDLPSGANFNVYYQDPSKSAFRHRSNAANTVGNTTVIDHPMLNGNNCAQLQITQDIGSLVGLDVPMGVYYDGNRWRIFTQDLTAMPTNVNFHVTVSPEQANACDLIFETDFGL